MFDYFNKALMQLNSDLGPLLPHTACPDRFLDLKLHGIETANLLAEDDEAYSGVVILGYALQGIIAQFVEDHIFTEPLLCFTPKDRVFTLKIGMMKKDKWEEIQKAKRKEDDNQ